MNKPQIKYEYRSLEEGEHLYDGYDLNEDKEVKAEYIISSNPIHQGNPYIEALPVARDRKATEIAYQQPAAGYNRKAIENLNPFERMSAVKGIRKFRVQFAFHEQLEAHFNTLLKESYEERHVEVMKSGRIMLRGRNTDPTNEGLALLGLSGCGKTSAIATLLSNYPQVILHDFGEMDKRTQVVYLPVVVSTNSNFKALFRDLGIALDKALGLDDHRYEKAISKQSMSIGEKASLLTRWIEEFAIGIIIFDEIQQMDFSHTKENTFSTLMKIKNETKVAMLFVGTDAAYEKFRNSDEDTNRRYGATISANIYCSDKKTFDAICLKLFRYQYGYGNLIPTQEGIDALYEETQGVIDHIICIYMFLQFEMIQNHYPDTTLTRKMVLHIGDKYFKGMRKVLKSKKDVLAQKDYVAIMENSRLLAEQMIAEAAQKAAGEKALTEVQDGIDIQKIKEEAINNIKVVAEMNGLLLEDENINTAVDAIMVQENYQGASSMQIARVALEKLNKQAPKSRTKMPKKRAKMDEKHKAWALELQNTGDEI